MPQPIDLAKVLTRDGKHGFLDVKDPWQFCLDAARLLEYLRDEAEAQQFRLCPYWRGKGTCAFGCRDEPACITDQPNGGWEAAADKLVCEILRLAGGSS